MKANTRAGAKVYRAMWECQECQYKNEDWDSACLRCGQAQPPAGQELPIATPAAGGAPAAGAPDATAVAPTPAVSAPPAPAAVDATVVASAVPAMPPPRRRHRRAGAFELVLALVIIITVLGLAGVGYYAWSRGMLDAYMSASSTPPAPGAAAPAAPAATPQADAAVPAPAAAPLTEQDILEDPLERVLGAHSPGANLLKPFVEPLRTIRDALRATNFTSSERGELNPESLTLLEATAKLGEDLLAQYQAFERKVARIRNEETLALVELMRGEFQARSMELMDVLGEAYALDQAGTNHAYTLSDDVPRALELGGKIDPAPVREHWQKALNARAQMFLDLKNVEAYRQLGARYQALVEIHNQFNQAMEAVPPYKTRAGMLDSNGVKALELYDQLATKIEELTLDFDSYAATLDPQTASDKRKELLAKYLELAQADHYTCFLETYKIYAMDHDLTHEAYTNMIDVHYPWVKEHWPNREPDYSAVSLKYEEEWKQRWHKK